jgi:hypothetical protein
LAPATKAMTLDIIDLSPSKDYLMRFIVAVEVSYLNSNY